MEFINTHINNDILTNSSSDSESDSNSDSNSDSDSDSDSELEQKKQKQKLIQKQNLKQKQKSKTKLKKELKIMKNLNSIDKSEIETPELYDNNDLVEDDYFIVNLRIKQRNTRKYTTTIENIPEKYLSKDNLNAFLIKLRNAISTRATFKEEKNIKFIEVSGNKTDIIIKLLCEYLNCSTESIRVHGN